MQNCTCKAKVNALNGFKMIRDHAILHMLAEKLMPRLMLLMFNDQTLSSI